MSRPTPHEIDDVTCANCGCNITVSEKIIAAYDQGRQVVCAQLKNPTEEMVGMVEQALLDYGRGDELSRPLAIEMLSDLAERLEGKPQ